MTQTSAPWDGILLGDASAAPYSSAEWAHLWAQLHGVGSLFPNYGILPGTGNGTYDPLQVIATGASNVDVKIGAALVNGKLYETDAAVTLTVGANVSGNPRIDTVVLRTDYVAQTIRSVILQGTPAVSPVRPTLTQNATTWELPLADIAAANGFASITAADITDRRRFAHSTGAGWQPYAYPLNTNPNDPYTSAYIIVIGTGIALPITVAGNMLVQQLVVRARANASPLVTWGIYAQDLNEDPTVKLVRRVGGRDTASTTAVTSGSSAAFPAIPAPFPLAPGAYWLVIKAASANLTIGYTATAANDFNDGLNNLRINTAAPALGQTLDLTSVGGWVNAADTDDSYGIRLEGRVFGEATAF
jgi:hypothetical protein